MDDNDEPLVDRLIRDAYGIVASPDRLLSLLQSADAPGGPDRTALEGVDNHFVEAGRLIDQVSDLIGSDFSDFEIEGDACRTGALVLDNELRVHGFDEASFSGEGLAVGSFAPEWIWDPIERDDDIRRVTRAGAGSSQGFLRLFSSPEDEDGVWYRIEAQHMGEDRTIALEPVQFRWSESRGIKFAEALRLTDTELLLTRHLVNGGSVREFAEQRGRSVGTARNQLKALCRKLAIRSQQELLMLYTGFAHSLGVIDGEAGTERHFCTRIHRESDGNRIAWEEHGDPKGLPVLYFHPFFEGALFTAEQDMAARAEGLRIIAPWRPFSGETTGEGRRLDLPRNFARRLPALLDMLGVGKCAVLAATAGAPFGLSFAQMHPDRTVGAVLAGPVTPFATLADMRAANPGYYRVLQLTRLAPAFARIYIRATLAGSLKGDFDTYIDDFLGDTRADLTFFRDKAIRETIRLAGSYTFAKTLEGPSEGVILESMDWSALCRDIRVPVTVAIGKTSQEAWHASKIAFANRFGFTVDDHFYRSEQQVMHDDPRRIFGTLRDMFGE